MEAAKAEQAKVRAAQADLEKKERQLAVEAQRVAEAKYTSLEHTTSRHISTNHNTFDTKVAQPSHSAENSYTSDHTSFDIK